ncbi:unnamed protein product [Caenorhabditis bovis]|uniref:PAP-associated domain-containing protein n=1 Tax=Caenorhabditis bovis TaxID=2654633 RepID=A0A8S1EX58_9PELO|nr:unnamed protein product [Caenorhabditis bovis]
MFQIPPIVAHPQLPLRKMSSIGSPTKASLNGSSGYYDEEEVMVAMPERALIECIVNLAVSKRPPHLRPPAAFCLPLVSMSNDRSNGHALRQMVVTSVFDVLHPYVSLIPSCRDDMANAMHAYYSKNSIEQEQLEQVHRFALEMQVHLSACFGCRVILDIYGSTRNGFGTRFCDVDMSLSFYPTPPMWATNADRVMRAVAKALVDFPKAVDERYVNAKVPIVRFRSSDMDLEADISYCNDLAIHNTKLLHQYCKWDPHRLPTLGVWVKAWAKRCGIGEASRGSLSSYAWIVMLIHYLQQIEPLSMIPCLQESTHDGRADPIYVQNYNVYFWKFVDPSRSRNCRATVLDLFVGFLEYYSSYFDYVDHVIQIASKSIKFKPERWLKFPMCISDPFETDHNLAQGVDVPMFNYIRSCMKHSYHVFTDREVRTSFLSRYGTDVDDYSSMLRYRMDEDTAADFAEYLLDKCVMVERAPHRQFRDRSMSQSTSTSNTSIGS